MRLLPCLPYMTPYSQPQVSARIRDDLLNRAKEFGIMLEDVSIVSHLSPISSLKYVLLLCNHHPSPPFCPLTPVLRPT